MRIVVEKAGTKKVTLATGAIEVINPPEKLQLAYEDLEVILELTGSKEQLETVSEESVKGYIDLKDYTKEGTYEVVVSLKDMPANCSVEGTVTIQLKKK